MMMEFTIAARCTVPRKEDRDVLATLLSEYATRLKVAFRMVLPGANSHLEVVAFTEDFFNGETVVTEYAHKPILGYEG